MGPGGKATGTRVALGTEVQFLPQGRTWEQGRSLAVTRGTTACAPQPTGQGRSSFIVVCPRGGLVQERVDPKARLGPSTLPLFMAFGYQIASLGFTREAGPIQQRL